MLTPTCELLRMVWDCPKCGPNHFTPLGTWGDDLREWYLCRSCGQQYPSQEQFRIKEGMTYQEIYRQSQGAERVAA